MRRTLDTHFYNLVSRRHHRIHHDNIDNCHRQYRTSIEYTFLFWHRNCLVVPSRCCCCSHIAGMNHRACRGFRSSCRHKSRTLYQSVLRYNSRRRHSPQWERTGLHTNDPKRLCRDSGKVGSQFHFRAKDLHRNLLCNGRSYSRLWSLGIGYILQFLGCKWRRGRCSCKLDSRGSSSSRFDIDYIPCRRFSDGSYIDQ